MLQRAHLLPIFEQFDRTVYGQFLLNIFSESASSAIVQNASKPPTNWNLSGSDWLHLRSPSLAFTPTDAIEIALSRQLSSISMETTRGTEANCFCKSAQIPLTSKNVISGPSSLSLSHTQTRLLSSRPSRTSTSFLSLSLSLSHSICLSLSHAQAPSRTF